MKRDIFIFAFFLMCTLISAQTNYYVSEYGDDANDGLTEATPIATLLQAKTLISANSDGDTEFIINIIGTVTDSKTNSQYKFNSSEDITLTIKGESAGTSIIQKVDDETWLEYVESGTEAGRFFNMPQNAGDGSLTIIFEDVTFQNFGHNAANGGMFINALLDCDIIVRRCIFRNGIARAGALFQTNANQRIVNLTMEDCFIENMLTFNYGGIFDSPIIIRGYSSGTFKNCVSFYW